MRDLTTKHSTAADKRPLIGIAGFFGYGNYGDELFLEVFKEHLGEDFRLAVLPDLPSKPYFSGPVEAAVEKVDAILIGGGDLLQPWGVDPRYFHRAYLQKPVFVAGVGVPIRKGGTDGTAAQVEKDWVVAKHRAFFQHESVKFINLRDEQSASWVKTKINPSVEVIEAPDLVCALTLPEVDRPKENILSIVTRYRPGRDGENADDFSQLAALGRYAIAEGWKVRHIILGTGEVGSRDLESAKRLDISGKELVFSERIDDLSRAIGECSAQASMKFHGSVVAAMYGVPSVVLVPTSKNRNFMRRIGREELLCQFDSSELLARFNPFPAPISREWVTRLRVGATDMLARLRRSIHDALGR